MRDSATPAMLEGAVTMGIHDGHRQRKKQQFLQQGLDGFTDIQALELLLFYARARGDVNPLAHALIDAFGSLKGVLEARPEQLLRVSGMTQTKTSLIGKHHRKIVLHAHVHQLLHLLNRATQVVATMESETIRRLSKKAMRRTT